MIDDYEFYNAGTGAACWVVVPKKAPIAVKRRALMACDGIVAGEFEIVRFNESLSRFHEPAGEIPPTFWSLGALVYDRGRDWP